MEAKKEGREGRRRREWKINLQLWLRQVQKQPSEMLIWQLRRTHWKNSSWLVDTASKEFNFSSDYPQRILN